MSKLRSFLALDGVDRVASVEAMMDLATAAILVRLVPPRRWRSRFGAVAKADPSETISRAHLAVIRRVRLAVARAHRNVPSSPNCLPQALAGRWMLERRGIRSSLYIGTQRDSGGLPRFHAWLKVGSEWVTGQCDESHYNLLVTQEAEAA